MECQIFFTRLIYRNSSHSPLSENGDMLRCCHYLSQLVGDEDYRFALTRQFALFRTTLRPHRASRLMWFIQDQEISPIESGDFHSPRTLPTPMRAFVDGEAACVGKLEALLSLSQVQLDAFCGSTPRIMFCATVNDGTNRSAGAPFQYSALSHQKGRALRLACH